MTEINITANSKNNIIDTDTKTSILTISVLFCGNIVIFFYHFVLLMLYGRNPTYLSWLIAFEAIGLIVVTRLSLSRHIVLVHCFSDGKELLGWTDVVMPYISLLGLWIPVSIFAFIISQKNPLATIYSYTIFALVYACGIVRLYRFSSQRWPIMSVIAIWIGTLGCPIALIGITPTENIPVPIIGSHLVMVAGYGIASVYCVWLCINFHRKGATA